MKSIFKTYPLPLIFFLFCFLLSGCAVLIRTPAYSPPPLSSPRQAEGGEERGWYRGIFHVHSKHSDDSKASLDLIMETARRAGLDFVVITDHNTLEGCRTGTARRARTDPLIICGSEISTRDGHLIALGIHDLVSIVGARHASPLQQGQTQGSAPTTQQIIDRIHAQGGFAVVAHPIGSRTPWRNWHVRGIDGLEIYNFAYAFYLQNKFKLLLKASFLTPGAFLRSAAKPKHLALNLWEERMKRERALDPVGARRPVALGGTDAHLHYKWLGFKPENFLLYFQSITMIVEAKELTEQAVLKALFEGKSFLAFEGRGPANQFRFQARRGSQVFGMGERIFRDAGNPVRFTVKAPKSSEMKLIRNGKTLSQKKGFELSVTQGETGTYRVEVSREGKPWIISNPIYVE